jgi:phosphate transport system protein
VAIEHGHIVQSYEQELQSLGAKLLEMGGLAERLLSDSVAALVSRDAERAARVIGADARIDQLESEVENQAIVMIARRQPLAVDLRQIVAAIRIAADLERIGDMAKNIAKRATAIGPERQPQKVSVGVEHMTEIALDLLKEVLDAYVARDGQKALEIRRRDEEIDAIHTSLFRELLTYMMEDPRTITMCTHLLFCAKNIERVGDHVTNIAETIYYVATGEPLRDERPKSDASSLTTVPFRPAGDAT